MGIGLGLGAVGFTGAGALLRRPSDAVPAGDRPITTAKITREDLVELRTVPGELSYGLEQLVASRVTGTITELPAVGEIVNRGGRLFRVDDQPVVLFFGTLPAFRALSAPTNGKDVKQFKENLRALGYSGFSVDDNYNEQAAAAVRRWQKDLGLPQSGTVELGRVFYTAGPLRVASTKVAAGAEASGAILAVTSTTRMVSAKIKAYDETIARPGTKATVELANGKQIQGVVQSIHAAPDSESAGQDPALEALLSFDDPAAIADANPSGIRVRFVVQERKGVLVAPVGALVALAGGGFGLQILDGDSNRYVAVKTGLFASGKVEVDGPDLAEGMTIGMAQ
jgi:peptidoglycan hydrolase-like protein with peptidoglycan-binding domain